MKFLERSKHASIIYFDVDFGQTGEYDATRPMSHVTPLFIIRSLDANLPCSIDILYNQVFFAAGWFECAAYERQWNQEGRVPGDYGYDPLGFTKREGGFDSEEIKSLRMKEIKNGRLAMMTIAAWVSNDLIPGALPVWHP